MKKISILNVLSVAFLLLYSSSVISQVDPSQEEILIPGGTENIGQLEFIINNDVDENGDRLNPNRVYVLEKDQFYIQQAAITFSDSNATLIIRGQTGGKMPIVLMNPAGDVLEFANSCAGNLTLENVYWPAMNQKQEGTTLFNFTGPTATLKVDNFVTENARADVFGLRGVRGYANVYIKNSYFRDLSQLSNSWNYVIFARGDEGEPFDTLWVENTTVSNGGMPLFGKDNTVEFFYLNHNTFYNSTKYPIWQERFREAYIVNNLFLNSNWEGECEATWSTQIGEDFIKGGQIRFDTIEPAFWSRLSPEVEAPAQADVKILASNNLNWVSPLFDPYYNGTYNDQFDAPLSNRPWGTVGEGNTPTPVSVPVHMFADRELQLIADWPGIKADNNWDLDTDPGIVTQSPADAAAAVEFANFARENYQATSGGSWDRTKIWFGDGDALTIPGNGTEDGGGFVDVTEMPEDFSYTNDNVRSLIDGKPLGALHWWTGEIATWDSEAALEDVLKYYQDTIAVGINDRAIQLDNAVSIYPNPANTVLFIEGKSELLSARFFDVTGKLVRQVDLNGLYKRNLDISGLENGMYILQVEQASGETRSLKFLKK